RCEYYWCVRWERIQYWRRSCCRYQFVEFGKSSIERSDHLAQIYCSLVLSIQILVIKDEHIIRKQYISLPCHALHFLVKGRIFGRIIFHPGDLCRATCYP